MAIAVADVVSPKGALVRTVLFPDEVQAVWEERLEAYIADGDARAAGGDLGAEDADLFTFHWVHYRAYQAAYEQRNASPASAELPEGGSFSFLAAQITNMKEMAAEHKASADAILSPIAASGWGQASVVRGS